MTQDNRNKVGMKLNRIYVMFVRFSQPSLFRARRRWVPAEVGLERLVPQAGSIRPDEALA